MFMDGDYNGVLFYFSLSLIFLIFSLKFLFHSRTPKPNHNLPPSPRGWLPVIGHLHLLKPPIHRTLRSLSERWGGGGGVISLRLGSRLVFVVSSNTLAEECFTKNDIILANRPPLLISKHVGYNNTNMIAAPYGDHWRNLRRIGSIEIFSSHRLNSFLSIRTDEVRRLILRLYHASSGQVDGSSKVVDMRPLFTDLTLNNIMRMVAGKRYYGGDMEEVDDEEAKQVRKLIAEVAAYTGSGNAADYMPMLRWVSSYEKRVEKLGMRMDKFLQSLIDEKRRQREAGNTMIDYMLSLQESQPQYYTDQIIKGFILIMVFAGTNTTAVTLEWALSNLLNHPDITSKARLEIDNQIGSDRFIDETDIHNLPYLQNIVLETLRLHPAAPLLVPHMASKDCTVGSYDMPRGTTLLVNAGAIHRDPKLWDEPNSFKPDRFNIEGEAQKLMAFGLGRRACPGSGLAQRLMSLTLGSLIQCFEWDRESEDEIDMNEGVGNTVPKETPLRAICTARPIVQNIL